MPSHLLPRVVVGLLLAVSPLAVSSVSAQDLVGESVPEKWLDLYLPEDLPELKHPAYASTLDKAKSELFSGRYKKPLLTIGELPAEALDLVA